MELHTLSGYLGTGIVIGGYISQIARLVRTRQAEGVSGRAYVLWAVASGFLLIHARSVRAVVFTVRLISQILACVLIATSATGIPAIRAFRRSRSQAFGLL
jgi:hypothetical protein